MANIGNLVSQLALDASLFASPLADIKEAASLKSSFRGLDLIVDKLPYHRLERISSVLDRPYIPESVGDLASLLPPCVRARGFPFCI